MMTHGGRAALRFALAVLVSAAAWGCFEYKEVLTLKDDGSGTVHITATVPESTAAQFRTEESEGKTPAPVRAGVIQQMMVGTRNARLARCDVTLENGLWTYDVIVEFTNIRELTKVVYFKQRNVRVELATAKEMRFHEEIRPSLVQMAKDQAKVLTEDAYSKALLDKAEKPVFQALVESAKMTFEVVLPGIGATFEGQYFIEKDERGESMIRATKEFKQSDFAPTATNPVFDVTAIMPPERGFTSLVVLLLLASLVGAVIPALRLFVLKMHRSA